MNRFYQNGDGFFTTLLRWNEQFCGLTLHFDRLKRQSEIFGLDLPFSSADELKTWLYEHDIPGSVAVRIIVTATETDRLYKRKNSKSEPLIELRNLNPELELLREDGILLALSSLDFQTPFPGLSSLKWSHFQPWALIRNHDPAGYDTIIRNKGTLLETTTASLVARKADGTWVLNSQTGDVLDSVIIRIFRKFCSETGQSLIDSTFSVEDLTAYRNWFYANSTHGLIPVHLVEGKSQKWHITCDSEPAKTFWNYYTSLS